MCKFFLKSLCKNNFIFKIYIYLHKFLTKKLYNYGKKEIQKEKKHEQNFKSFTRN